MSSIKEKNYEILCADIFYCVKCPRLNIAKKTMSAPGYGSRNADLFVVGQSLHSYNDETPDEQIPFVGPKDIYDSGDLLFECLDAANFGLSAGNTFISNVVHCHTPGNRPSTNAEIVNCKSYLDREIEIVKPKIILALGRDAKEHFRLLSFSKFCFSKISAIEKIQYVVAYHPSYILRYKANQKDKYIKSIVRDLTKAKKRVGLL